MIKEKSLAKYFEQKSYRGRMFFVDDKPLVRLDYFPNGGGMWSTEHTKKTKRYQNGAPEGRYTIFWRIKPISPLEGFRKAEDLGKTIFRHQARNAGKCELVDEPFKILTEHFFWGDTFDPFNYLIYYESNHAVIAEKSQKESLEKFLEASKDALGPSTYALTDYRNQLSKSWNDGIILQVDSGGTKFCEMAVCMNCTCFPKEFITKLFFETSVEPISEKDAAEVISRAQRFLHQKLKRIFG